MIPDILFFGFLFCVFLIVVFVPKPQCPDCKTGTLKQTGVHNPDRWGTGTNIYICNSCSKEFV